ncbi:MAG TPA: hypothetical protein VHF27_01895 [Acidimicrobiales bacterium]|nr:hypothetical protein [Acidimicrobiales bacterium]
MTPDDDEVVSQYIQAIEAARAAPGGFLDPDRAAATLAGAEMVAGEDREGLEAQLAESVPGSEGHLRKLEDDFVRVAAGYGERHGMTYESWRQTGVEPDVLTRAGIDAPSE